MAVTGEMTEEQERHAEFIDSMDGIAGAINSITAESKPPIVNVKVDSPIVKVPSSKVVLSVRKPVSYVFTIVRQQNGFIESVIARPVIE